MTLRTPETGTATPDPEPSANAAADPVESLPAWICATLGGVPLVLTTANRVPLPSSVVTEPLAVVDPVCVPVGLVRLGAMVSAAVVVNWTLDTTVDWFVAASSCIRCAKYDVDAVRPVALIVLAPVEEIARLPANVAATPLLSCPSLT